MLEMVQLWVNLPAKLKMGPPAYQTILDRKFPSVSLPDDAGTVRVIAGEFDGTKGRGKDLHPHQSLGGESPYRKVSGVFAA